MIILGCFGGTTILGNPHLGIVRGRYPTYFVKRVAINDIIPCSLRQQHTPLFILSFFYPNTPPPVFKKKTTTEGAFFQSPLTKGTLSPPVNLTSPPISESTKPLGNKKEAPALDDCIFTYLESQGPYL